MILNRCRTSDIYWYTCLREKELLKSLCHFHVDLVSHVEIEVIRGYLAVVQY